MKRSQVLAKGSQLTLLLSCCVMLLFVGGCSCWKDPLGKNETKTPKKPQTLEEMEARRKELQDKEEKLPDFETERLSVLPSDDDTPAGSKVKPGHWFNAVQSMKANAFDFPKGELEAQCVDTRANPIRLTNTEFHLNSTRPANLPKGQMKHFDILLHASKPTKGPINFITRLRPKGGGRDVEWKSQVTSRMKKFQNHMVVLSDRPDNYQFVKTLRSVKPLRSRDQLFTVDLDYFVKLPKGTRRIDVPSHPMAWTSTAYVLWDDFDPEIMTAEQQQAMIDWLYWGGQLIINGPQTLDKLRSSQFADVLPAKSGTVGRVTEDQVNELNSMWSFNVEGASHLVLAEKEDDRPLALDLELTEGSHFVESTSNLVAEKLVGRGRVVATAFNIPHAFFQKWDSFDTFFNGCLLGRPPRRFSNTGSGGITERWDTVSGSVGRDNPLLTSNMRYFSRDAMSVTNRSSNTSSNTSAIRIRGGSRLTKVSPGSSLGQRIAPMPVRNMPGLAASRPGVDLKIVGVEQMEVNEEERFVIDFKNTGNQPIINGRLMVTVDGDLNPVRATVGHSAQRSARVLTWAVDPMMVQSGSQVEVICKARKLPERGNGKITAEFISGSGNASADDDIVVDIGVAGSKHQLARVARHTFGVNGFRSSDFIGVAGWDDQSVISQQARRALEYAAGISVPAKSFVAKVIGLYLLVLVPLNWILFKLMGRVEWAWAAVPIIAMGGAIGVVRAAQLDIGFVRSRTEVAIVEMQPNYQRAHVTRYIGFYTSLSADYEISGEDETTLIQPLGLSTGVDDRDPTRGATIHQGNGIRMTGFDVTSNSTGMVHTEQMIDMGGSVSLDESQNRLVVANESDYDLKSAAVVRRTDDEEVEVAWIGELSKKERFTDLQFEPLDTANVAFDVWDEDPTTSKISSEGDLNIRRLMEIATDPKRLGRNEMVLIGLSSELLEGIKAKPSATQVTANTLFVVQLRHATRPEPARDANCFAVMDRALRAQEGDPDTIVY